MVADSKATKCSQNVIRIGQAILEEYRNEHFIYKKLNIEF